MTQQKGAGGVARWGALRDRLAVVEDRLRLSWDELDELVGGLPPSAYIHPEFWKGVRSGWPGFTTTCVRVGHEVTFVRTARRSIDVPATAEIAPESKTRAPFEPDADVIMVTCVKEKLDHPAAARDLYVSALFVKQLDYADASGRPWFILSAEHGLVGPDEWLAPYDRYLADTPSTFRAAWGQWVVERLALLIGPLHGLNVEVHAGRDYVDPLRGPLSAHGARLSEPLDGLRPGERQAWYLTNRRERRPAEVDANGDGSNARAYAKRRSIVAHLSHRLSDPAGLVGPGELLELPHSHLQGPGLYSWWVDETGARDLTAGIGEAVPPGLIYAGLAGATHWPSGKRSRNTLWDRLAGMHLGGRATMSTFRRSLASVLGAAGRVAQGDEAGLTEWMHAHLGLIAVPFGDADALADLEAGVLDYLDPPLNLRGMASTRGRHRLRELRRLSAKPALPPLG